MSCERCDVEAWNKPDDPFSYKYFCEFGPDDPIPSRIKPFSGWLARDGRFFLCGYAQHSVIARQLVKQEWPDEPRVNYIDADEWLVERGWHRIDPYGTVTTGYGQYHVGFSAEQESTMRRMLDLSEPGSEFEAAMLDYLEYIANEGVK